MSEVHSLDPEGPAVFGCAQGGCRICVEALIRHHEGLVHFFLRRLGYGEVDYDDVLQEGRIVLWRAVRRFDPQRGIAFSTYAGVGIQRQIWRVTNRAEQNRGEWSPPRRPDPVEAWEESWHRAEIRTALVRAVTRLPDRLRAIVVARYELDGQPRRSLKAIGRHMGISHTHVGNLQNDALTLLRLPAYSVELRALYGQNSRTAYARTEALSRTWLEKKRRRQGS